MRRLRWLVVAMLWVGASCGTAGESAVSAADAADASVSGDSVATQDPSTWDTEVSCAIDMTAGGETTTLIDETFVGFELNEFGAEIYGNMLKIWASAEGATGLEILVRTDQADLPGEVQPGVPGQTAWVLMMVDDLDVYSSQMPSGTITIDTCPSELGTVVSGTLSNVVVFSMGTMAPATLNGSFEVVLGQITGEAICSGL